MANYAFILLRDGKSVREGTLYRKAPVHVGDVLFGYDDDTWRVTRVEDMPSSRLDALVQCEPSGDRMRPEASRTS
jgi:hypothetical protein